MLSMIRKYSYPFFGFIDGLISQDVRRARDILDKYEKESLAELTKMRNVAFKSLVLDAYENVPYYRNLFDENCISPECIKGVEDIKKIPVLNKKDIHKAGNRLLSKRIKEYDYIISRSGGTTGEPIASYVNRIARAFSTYAALRGFIWMGWEPGTKIVSLFGGSLGLPTKNNLRGILRDFARGVVSLPAFDLHEKNAKDYLNTVTQSAPCIINGYASAVYNLALYAETLGYQSDAVKCVFTTAEYLPKTWAEKIHNVFSCPVRSYYGCGEVNSLGFQVEQGGAYWIPDEHVILESVNKKDDLDIDHDNSILVTSLYNYAQPLIRYQLGDIGQVTKPGVEHPTRSCINNLVGRTADMFVREDGTRFSSILGTYIIQKTELPVKRYQFIQKRVLHIDFLYEPELDDLTETQTQDVANILKQHISKNITVNFIKTSKFFLSPAGKFRIVISKIPQT